MALPKDDAATLSARWTEGVLLKRDVFSTVERGRFRDEAAEVDAVLRRLDQVPLWSYPLARHLFARERRALALARDLDVGPKLLWAGRKALVRGFIDGQNRGTTPSTVRDLSPGDHSVVLELRGRKVTQTVKIQAGTTSKLSVPIK